MYEGEGEKRSRGRRRERRCGEGMGECYEKGEEMFEKIRVSSSSSSSSFEIDR